MKTEIHTDEYKRVGPHADVYGHGPVTGIAPRDWPGAELYICLDCGYTAEDLRLFAHNGCEQEENLVTQSWREFIAASDDNTPVLPVSGTDQFPIE